ncbi:MAG TPA: clostripain-related cysteine peptidase [Acidobacteriota bacterium]
MRLPLLFRGIVCVLALCLVMAGMSASGINSGGNSPQAEAPNRWLLLLYDDGDFDNGFDALYAFASEAYAHTYLDVLVLQDNFTSPAMIWQIGSSHQLIPRKYLGEINMASPLSLEYFLKYAHSRYPDRRTILCFYDHGAGCWGACIDETNTTMDPTGPSILSLSGMRQALEKTKPVDLICFTAPCNMGSLEAAYELRRQTEAYVGSENTSGYVIWFGTIRFICDTLKNHPDIDANELAQAVVANSAADYRQYDPAGFEKYFTLSAVRCDDLDNAISSIRELTAAILGSQDESFSLLDQALGDIRIYSTYYADIIDLFEEAMKRCQNPFLRSSFQSAADAVRGAIMAKFYGAELPGSNGLNVYFPPPPNVGFSTGYGKLGISFAQDSGWFDFLNAYRMSRPMNTPLETLIPILQTDGLFLPPLGAEKLIPVRWINPARKDGVDK